MNPAQFRILYRQFLFRMVDIELLSADARGDTSKLFGQFAALLIAVSIPLSVIGAEVGGLSLVFQWSGVHFVIATTMLVVGLFAVLTWDSTFPDRRDVMVLAPLPIRSRTVFLAKLAAVTTALGVTIGALHIFAGFVWPLALNNRHEEAIAPSIGYSAAMPPVGAADLEQALTRDLAPALKAGALGPDTGGGVTVGVWKQGERRIFAYGTAKTDSIFEIGSITKPFTALALAQLAIQGKVRLDEPVRALLPPDTVPQPDGPEITLLDLATHRSGLAPFPYNLHPTNRLNPFAFREYGAEQLYAFLKSHGVAKPENARFLYSNLGYGVLGQALINRSGASYADLIGNITGPLGMHDTVVDLSPEQRGRLIQGYASPRVPVGGVDLGALAGAGAIRSTAADMLRYLSANLHPETVSDTGLRAAMQSEHKLRAPITPEAGIALAWIYYTNKGIYEHNGGTSGYTSDAFFSPAGDYAVIVLTNVGPDLFQFASMLAEHIRARLEGERAVSLNVALVPGSGGSAWDFLRLFAAWWITMMASGAFIYCCVLVAQGVAALLLPRRYFLRVSSWMQLGAFALLVAGYFLEPKVVTPSALLLHESSAYLEWSPSYWFLGLFQQWNGSPALPELAVRAWIALAIAFGATALVYTLAYLRTMRRIVEEPDIAPAAGGRSWLPGFGSGFATAIGQFAIRTILRSRQHRLLLAFYLGIGFALAIFFRRMDEAANALGNTVPLSVLGATILIAILSVAGIRVAFSLPIDMRANWIFRIVPIPAGPRCMSARRRAIYALSVVPVCLGAAVMLPSIWPWQTAVKHLAVLGLLAVAVAELCLHGTQKLPFTCSYLPGKSNFNITFLISCVLIFVALVNAAQLERDSFGNAPAYAALVGVLAAFAICARWSADRLAKSPEGELRFEEADEPAVRSLGLHRDGVTQVDSATCVTPNN